MNRGGGIFSPRENGTNGLELQLNKLHNADAIQKRSEMWTARTGDSTDGFDK